MFPAVLLTINLSSVAAVCFGGRPDRLRPDAGRRARRVPELPHPDPDGRDDGHVRPDDRPARLGLRRSYPGGAADVVVSGGARRRRHRASGAISLEVRHGEFAFPGAEQPVLHDINFHVDAGQTIAIIGSTGSGKTTLLNLVARLFDVTCGRGARRRRQRARARSPADRSLIGFVPQKPYLFSGTVATNLRFGDRTRPTTRCGRRWRWHRHATSSRPSPVGWSRRSPRAAPTSPAASASVSPSPVLSCATPPSTSSTTRSPPSTSPPTPGCAPRSRPSRGTR